IPDIYNVVLGQQNIIAELWTKQGWSFNFRREYNDREIARVAKFLNTVEAFNGLQTGEDVMWWKGNSRGEFKVNSAYKLMNQTTPQTHSWPWKQIWRSKIPHIISCFIWLFAKEVALTQDNLKKRGITLCSSCFLCEEALEKVSHLFLHCKYTQILSNTKYFFF
ncbi:hypothetical protein MTR67_016515, partial [Solanum verrucosum]